MTTTDGHDITTPLTHGEVAILDYLAALWAESEDLPPDLRDELMATAADYVARRRAAVSDPLTEAQEVLGRLGPPEALVAAARRGHLPYHLRLPAPAAAPAPAAGRAPAGPVEFSALALLTAGAVVVPVVAPAAGLLLASGSSRWTATQKTLAWIFTFSSAGFALLLALAAGPVGHGFVLLLAYLATVTGPAVASVVLFQGISREK